MKKLVVGLLSLVLLCDKVHAQPYNYAEALQKSLLFYDTQRSGAVGTTSRANWRGNSHMRDGSVISQSAAPNPLPTSPRWNLSGGWYDGGGHVKWNNSMSFAMSTLAWGAAEYKAGYVNTGQMPFLLDQLRWCGDYFIKCVTFTSRNDVSTYRIAIDVGMDSIDNTTLNPGVVENNFGAAREVVHRFVPRRAVFFANLNRSQSGSVAAMAAALASAAYVLRDNGDIPKSDEYLATAIKLYEFATTFRLILPNAGNVNPTENNQYRNFLGTNVNVTGPMLPRDDDPLSFAAIWIHKASVLKEPLYNTDGNEYLLKALTHARVITFEISNSTYNISAYKFASMILLSKYFSSQPAHELFSGFGQGTLRPWINGIIENNFNICMDSLNSIDGQGRLRLDQTTRGWSAGGLTRVQEMYSIDRSREGIGREHIGSLRHVNNQAFCAFVYADYIATTGTGANYGNSVLSNRLKKWAQRQLDYTLGSNPQNRSYVHGFQPAGKTSLATAPHSTARGTWAGREHDNPTKPEFQPNYRHIPFGAVAGGPDFNDKYWALDGLPAPADTVFPRGMNINHQTKVSIDGNAGFTGSLARMASVGAPGAVLPNFPAPSLRVGAIDEEYFVEAEQTTTTNSIQIRARMNNRSRWPATVRNRMSFKYFFVPEAGAVITPSIITFTGTAPLEAAVNAQISAPVNYEGNKFYVTVSFPGDTIFPGYAPPASRRYYREVIFKLTSSTTWDNTNDFSFAGFTPLANVVPPNIAPKIAVYDNGMRIGGQEESPLSVSKRTTKANLSLSPNPAKNDFNLSWDLSTNQSKQVDVYDMLGKKVSSFKNITGPSLNIQVAGLKPGMYIVDVRLSNNQESLGKIKFVKE